MSYHVAFTLEFAKLAVGCTGDVGGPMEVRRSQKLGYAHKNAALTRRQ
jgi:hypothetical protein